jgi:hypothetical protein
VRRLYTAAGALLVFGLLLVGAGVAPTIGCERAYAVDLSEGTAGQGSDAVVDAERLPEALRNATQRAADTGDPATTSRVEYIEHLDGRAVTVDGTVYAAELVVTESCGGVLQTVAFVLGTTLATLGALALPLLVLYQTNGPPLNRLHGLAVVVLVVGAATFAGGIAAPAGCQDNFALETTELQDPDASDEPVVDVTTFPTDLQNATEKSVESNRTAFVDRSAYREHVEGRNVRFAGTTYDADVVLVQDCGGGIDDALLVVGLVLATAAAVVLSLLVVLDHGEKVL